jgi:hypothetical protein
MCDRAAILVTEIEEETATMFLCLIHGTSYWVPKRYVPGAIGECDVRAAIPMELATTFCLLDTPEQRFEERAAICEYEGNMSREEAEQRARLELI